MKHDDSCNQPAGHTSTRHFEGLCWRNEYGTRTELVLGTVTRGYPHYVYCSRSRPWTAFPRVPDRFYEEVSDSLKFGSLGSFKTRGDALNALESWWLKRLGVETDTAALSDQHGPEAEGSAKP